MPNTIELVIAGRDKASDVIGGVTGGLKTMATVAGDVVVAGLGAMAGAIGVGISQAMDMGSALNRFSAQTGITGAALDEFGAIGNDIFRAGWGESLGDVTQAMSDVKTITGASADELEGLTEKALILQDAFDKDVRESVRAVDTAMENFGATGSEMFDLITAGLQRTGDPADDLLDTINEYSADFAEAGFSAQEMMSVLVSGAEAGVFNLDKVADSVREFSTRVIDGSDTSRDALAALGIDADALYAGFADGSVTTKQALDQVVKSLEDMDDDVQRDTAGVALFGSLWEDLGSQAIFALDELEQGLGDVGGATDAAGDALQKGMGPAFERLKRTVLGTLGEAMTPFIENLSELAEEYGPLVSEWVQDSLVPALSEAAEWIVAQLVPAMGELVAWIVDSVVPALGELVAWVIDNVVPVLGELVAWIIDNVVPAIEDLWTWISANVIPAITDLWMWISRSLVPALMTLAEWFQNDVVPALQAFYEFILANVIPIVQEVARFIVAEFSVVVAWVEENWPLIQDTVQRILEFVQDLIERVLTFISDFWKEHGDRILNIVQNVWSAIQTVVDTVINAVLGIVKAVMQAIQGDWTAVWTTILGVAGTIWDGIKTLVGLALDNLKNIIPMALTALKATWEALWNIIKAVLETAWTAMVALVDVAFGILKSKVNEGLKALREIFKFIWDSIKEKVSSVWEGIKGFVQGGIDKVVGIIEGVVDRMREAGKAIVEAVRQGIADAWDGLVSWFNDRLGDLGDLLPWSEPEDPSSRLRGLGRAGEAIVGNLLAGFEEALPRFEAAMQSLPAPQVEAAGSTSITRTNHFHLMANYREREREDLAMDVRLLRLLYGNS